MAAEFITVKPAGAPALDLFPTGVTDEWEAKDVTGEHRGFFTDVEVLSYLADIIFEGAPVSAL